MAHTVDQRRAKDPAVIRSGRCVDWMGLLGGVELKRHRRAKFEFDVVVFLFMMAMFYFTHR